jgi:hypothetical protein
MDAIDWLGEMSPPTLEKRIPNREYRHRPSCAAVHYEATRAGLDPQLVLGLMQVESGFKKYAVSSAGARGYMQVMPFWVKLIGRRTTTSSTCAPTCATAAPSCATTWISKRATSFRALGRYNGSLGKPEYPTWFRAAWQNQWSYDKPARLGRRAP